MSTSANAAATSLPSAPINSALIASPLLQANFVNAPLPKWLSPWYAELAKPINTGFSLGYPNGALYPMPSNTNATAGNWSGEASVNCNPAGYEVLGNPAYIGIRTSSGGYALVMQKMTTTQMALLPKQFSSTEWLGASLTTFPGAAGEGIYQWNVQFTAGKGLWQSCILFDQNSTNAICKTEIDFEFNGDNHDCLYLTLHWYDTTKQAMQSSNTIEANVGVDLTTSGQVPLVTSWSSGSVDFYCNNKQIGQVATPSFFTEHQVQMMNNFAMSDGGWFPAADSTTPQTSYMHVAGMSYWPWAV